MSNEYNNWNKPFKRPRLNVRPPPQLKGKEIGLFYKNLNRRDKGEPRPKKENSVTFTMPPTVAITMKKNIQTLLKTGLMENIKIPQLKLSYMDSDLLPVKKELEENTNDNIEKIFDEERQQYVHGEGNIATVKSEPIDDDSMNMDCSEQETNTVVETYDNPKVSLEQNTELNNDEILTVQGTIPTVKSEPIDDVSMNIDDSEQEMNPIDETHETPKVSEQEMNPVDETHEKSKVQLEPLPIKKELEEKTNGNIKKISDQLAQQYVHVESNIATVKSEPIDDDSMNMDSSEQETITIDETHDNTKVNLETNNELNNDKKLTIQAETESSPPVTKLNNPLPGTSTSPDYNCLDSGASQSQLELRSCPTFKYGYEDIITGTFDEKLEACLANGIDITKNKPQNKDLNEALCIEYQDMIRKTQYIKMMEFRKTLPTYKMSNQILEAISKNQVIVISGETGCGKSTQVPQIILDDAILNNRGPNVKILVTQPRRIAASSLATRVAKERAEKVGNSVGYAVRLERVNERSYASIQYCTTGILLTDLETNQSLSNYSHVILDEVHERDTHIDISMCVLKQVLKKRKDLKLVLMSATIDSERLSEYFDNCLMMHIEGLAFPVRDVYLEEVLELTKFRLPYIDTQAQRQNQNLPRWINKRNHLAKLKLREDEKLANYLNEVGDWINSKKNELDVNVIKTLKNPKIEELNFDLIVELIKYISTREPGAILVFLPGFTEISKLLNLLYDYNIRAPLFEIHSLHSKLPSLEQNKIFERPQNNIRKIIVATNIAETSITIDDIVYVIDCGRHKITGLNVEENVQTLEVQYISQANLRQRRGRAGRCQAGVCYHLLTSFRAARLEARTRPELQRSGLLEAVLMVKRLRLGLAAAALARVPSPPAVTSVQWAVKQLQRCGALDAQETLTPLGWHMARLPVHPSAGKALLLGALFGCLDRAASVAAVWGFKDPFVMVVGKERQIEECKRNFTLGEPSDHVTISEALINFERCPPRERRDYCYANFLSYSTCELLSDMKSQLGGNLKAMGFLPSGDIKSHWENRNANNMSLFKAIIAAALYPNIATTKWLGLNSRKRHVNIRVIAHTPEDGRVAIHPSSVMASRVKTKFGPGRSVSCSKPGANWLVYWLKRRSTNLFVLEVTLIYSLPLLFFGDFILSPDPDTPDGCFLDVSSVKVRVSKETADLLHDLRALLDQVLATKVMSDAQPTRMNKFDDQVLNTVIELITAEDEQAAYLGEDLTVGEDFTDSDFSENDTDGSFVHF